MNIYIYLRKSAIFQPSMRGTAKQHGFFAHWDQFGRETRAWPDGADPPHFHMHIGKIGQFFKIRGFHQSQAGLCHPGAAKTAKKHASFKIWPTARKRQKINKTNKNGQK